MRIIGPLAVALDRNISVSSNRKFLETGSLFLARRQRQIINVSYINYLDKKGMSLLRDLDGINTIRLCRILTF
ncbi:hypothetical protein, partial [Vibrio zhanjiangensis]|uniref:hypothetical protein n=1 Tax=Vibrio zhanjiangensis TaxID=1046128 RepID=UPI0024E173C6